MKEISKKLLISRVLIFTKERFPPLTHIPYLVLLFLAHSLVAFKTFSVDIRFQVKEMLSLIVIFLILYHLRVFDDVKDYETDIKLYPDRPLPRGLLSKKEAVMLATGCLIGELILCFFLSPRGIPIVLLTIGYSLLMYRSFFAKEWVESKILLFVVSHTFISFFISLVLFSLILDKPFWEAPPAVLTFGLVNWFVSIGYDFSRKLKTTQEAGYEMAYNKVLGKFRAVLYTVISLLLVLSACFFTGIQLKLKDFYRILLYILTGDLLIVTFLACWVKKEKGLKILQLTGMGFSVLIYAIVIGGILWTTGIM